MKRSIARVQWILSKGEASPFEFEGACVAGLRSAFCLQGHDWYLADSEARMIVNNGLKRNHAIRPDWSEGQLYYTVSEDYCSWCHGPMDRSDMTPGQRFCCRTCAVASIEHRAKREAIYTDAVRRSAKRLIDRLDSPPRPCKHCSKVFLSDKRDQQFCSPRCNSRFHHGDALLVPIDCQWCSKTFQPENSKQRYCSHSCHGFARRAEIKLSLAKTEMVCKCCGSNFVPTAEYSKYCSSRCASNMANRAYLARKGPRRYTLFCTWCDGEFTSKMPWARFCCKEHKRAGDALLKPSAKVKLLVPKLFDLVFGGPPAGAARPSKGKTSITPDLFDQVWLMAA